MKPHVPPRLPSRPQVAPHAGAWIETSGFWAVNMMCNVAPHAGAWIETCEVGVERVCVVSPPTRGRGLKPPLGGGSGVL